MILCVIGTKLSDVPWSWSFFLGRANFVDLAYINEVVGPVVEVLADNKGSLPWC